LACKQSRAKKIGELLVSQGLVSVEAVERALAAQQQAGGVIGEHLVRQGAIDERLLMKMLSKQTGLYHVNLHKITIRPEVQRRVTLDTARSLRVLPVAVDGHSLALGMVNPSDVGAERKVEEESGLNVRPLLLSGAQLDALFEQVGGVWGQGPLLLSGGPPASTVSHQRSDLAGMLATVATSQGQDLYLSSGAIPAMRQDGELHRLALPPLTGAEIEELVLPILTPAQRERFASELELDFAWIEPGAGRFRCNLFRQRGALAFTARHVRERIPSLGALGLPEFLARYALRKQGLALIVGPTGHGKTTTMASMLDVINRERHANVVTIEDPIEYVHQHRCSNVNQREVGTDTLSFAEGLRHALRQAPDVLVIGEIRDHESAATALSAAETGHLVLATMHSLSATAAVDRFIDFFPPNQQAQVRAQLGDALQLVFSQRLLRRAQRAGRVLAFEYAGASPLVRAAVREGRPHAIRTAMQSNAPDVGSIDVRLAELLVEGSVTREEAVKYCDSVGYLSELLRARGVVNPG
jgi:twitching motility protein PilT